MIPAALVTRMVRPESVRPVMRTGRVGARRRREKEKEAETKERKKMRKSKSNQRREKKN